MEFIDKKSRKKGIQNKKIPKKEEFWIRKTKNPKNR